MGSDVHPTAIVDEKAVLGENVTVGPYVIIEADTEVGDGTRIDAFTQIKSHTKIGKNNHFHSHSCIGGVPQDLKFKGEKSHLVLGDNNIIREFVTLNRGSSGGGGQTTIGSDCLLMAYVHVAHDCYVGDKVIFSNAVTLGGHVHVEPNVIVGGLAAVHQFVRLGRYSFIGGKTGVAQDVPPYMLAVGERAVIHGPNLVGIRRLKLPSDTIKAIKSTYKLLWRSGLSKTAALEQIEEQFGSIPEIAKIIEFTKQSERGLAPAE